MRNPLTPHLTSVPCNPQHELARMVTDLQREEALDLATRLLGIARHPSTPPALFIELGRNMEEALQLRAVADRLGAAS